MINFGVKIKTPPVNPDMTYETWKAAFLFIGVWASRCPLPVIFTSINDDDHTRNSRHYQKLAFDLRSHHINRDDLIAIVDLFNKKAYGTGYRAIIESFYKPNEHIHVGWKDQKGAW